MASAALGPDGDHAAELRGDGPGAFPLQHFQLLGVMTGMAGLAIGGGVG